VNGQALERVAAAELAWDASPLPKEAVGRDGARVLKRFLDVVAAVGLLVWSAPLCALVALAIKLEDGGPILFRQTRVGRKGALFTLRKLRSMRPDAEAESGPQCAAVNDPRVTRIGRYLRPLSIDELPQFFNVVFGEMSFVGPRPSPFRENQMCVPWREGRLSVRPGITGLWQVCRHDRSIGDFHQWIYYDLLYVRNTSFLVDLKIVLATIATLGGKWSVPLDWILSRSKYHDRRRSRRGPADARPSVAREA
jgi:lipopolysaccharide/colanic/teichoic acid biosynthesis glycosyltransferase